MPFGDFKGAPLQSLFEIEGRRPLATAADVGDSNASSAQSDWLM